MEFYRMLQVSVSRVITHYDPVNSQYLVNVVSRHRFWALTSNQSYAVALSSIGYVVVLLNVYLLSMLISRRIPASASWGMMLLSLSTPFIIATSWPHYFVFMPFVQMFLLNDVLRQASASRWWKISLLLIPSIVLSSILLFFILGNYVIYNQAGALFWSNALALLLVYVQLYPLLIRSHAEPRKQSLPVPHVS